ELTNEPVARQPRDPHHRAQNRRQHDAQGRDIKGIEQPNEKGARVGIGWGIGDQRLADAKRSFPIEKPETTGNVLTPQIEQGVVNEKGDQSSYDTDEEDLPHNAANPRVVPRRRTARPRPGWRGVGRHYLFIRSPLATAADQRIGIAYIRPPRVHRSLRPRS